MKKRAGKTNQIKSLVIFILFSFILFFQTAYPSQRKIVPDNAPSGIVRETCLRATAILAKIPELYGFWNPEFPASSDSVWHFSGSDRAETWMIYGGMQLEWPYKYLRYTANGQAPNYRWDQDQEMEATYFRGQINVTVSSGQAGSLWQDDWKSRAESDDRSSATQTLTVYSMGRAPEIVSEVLPGPIRTCEFKQKQYCGGSFQAEWLIYRDKYRLERYAIAGRGGGQYRILNRVIDRDHVTSIRARVRGTNPALGISVQVSNRDGKPADEAVVDQIITAILGAAFEASGLPNPCGDIGLPSWLPPDPYGTKKVSEPYIPSWLSWIKNSRASREVGRVKARGEAWIYSWGFKKWRKLATGIESAVYSGDVVATAPGSGNGATVQMDYGNHQYRVLIKDHSICRTALLEENMKAGFIYGLYLGAVQIKRRLFRDPAPTTDHPVYVETPYFFCPIKGTELILEHDPETKISSLYLFEGEVDVWSTRVKKLVNLTAGQKISGNERGLEEVQALDQREWISLINHSGFGGGGVPPAKDYIPELDATVVGVRFYEGSQDVVPPGQREYREEFSRSDSRIIYWELDLGHPTPGRRLPFDVDAVWYGPDGRESARHTLNAYMDSAWENSFYTSGRGWNVPGHWKPGPYRVELFIKGQKVAVGGFEITEGREGIGQQAYDVHSIQANVKSMRFFEAGYNTPPANERVYGTRFNWTAARYVWWELSLIHPAPGKRRDFSIRHVWKRGDGSVLADQEMGTFILDSWVNSEHCHSWGSSMVPNWQPGRYTLELYIDGTMIARGSFEVY